MNPDQKQLWHKIQDFQLDEQSADFKFSDRLARENGWTLSYAKRVIEEYKKFIFLCCISPTAVTPSDPVDQAWHLHLTYTQSYWERLCRDILHQEIHHHPTQGGAAEASKFNDYYSLTHQLYKAVFEIDPPANIWQNNQIRFTDVNFQRVNKNNYWLIRKSKVKLIATIFSLIIAHFLFVQASDSSAFEIVIVIIAVLAAFF